MSSSTIVQHGASLQDGLHLSAAAGGGGGPVVSRGTPLQDGLHHHHFSAAMVPRGSPLQDGLRLWSNLAQDPLKMVATPPRSSGCWVRSRRCPCGDEQCYVRTDGDVEDTAVVPVGPVDPSHSMGMLRTPSEGARPMDITPRVGQVFRSDDDAQEFYTNFARQNGFSIRRERSKGSQGHPLGIYKRELVCHRAGFAAPRKSVEVERQRNKKSSRCKCEARMIIKKDMKSGIPRWVVIQFSNEHNHELLDHEEVRHLPAYRNISVADQDRILVLSKAGCTVSLIMKMLELEKGVQTGQLPFIERDLRNFLQSSKSVDRENDGTELLKVCKGMKDKDMDFCYEFTMDENHKLEHIAWSYGDSIRAYSLFGDAVVFDTTCRLDAYDIHIGMWFGMDNHGNTTFFGCVLLRDEKPSSFQWALQAFLRIMNGRPPQTILTDIDTSLREAIVNELPETKHVFSIWHVMSKLYSWFFLPLGTQYEKFKSEFLRLYNLEVADDFEHQWEQMVIEFGLVSDRHITLLFSERPFWALPYLRGFFLARMTTVEHSKSISSFFKGFLNSRTRLKDFIERVAAAADLGNQAGEEATVRQKYQTINIKTCMPIEEHASPILTHYAFNMLQNEIVMSAQYALFDLANGNSLVRHRMKMDGGRGRVVSWIPSDEEVICSCKMFETTGILCRHALRMLTLKNCFNLPDKYLPIRWRRESSMFRKTNHSSQTGKIDRARALQSLTKMLVHESSLTKERFDYVQEEMMRLLTQVREMQASDKSPSDGDSDSSSGDITENVSGDSQLGSIGHVTQMGGEEQSRKRRRVKRKDSVM
ncbi:putative protein FAR1-RELATED SEQUENCE 10 [Acorus calamus]|uniref:Protein FAR1-RELATED SEQUENCE n=1 Tax=Acorus calamus TaxID=4465 RepID=A0AAV9EHB9_ACOCL|nr:putative protein FAR1-RELATED SEQUENCE 10 [Acorus calamus]